MKSVTFTLDWKTKRTICTLVSLLHFLPPFRLQPWLSIAVRKEFKRRRKETKCPPLIYSCLLFLCIPCVRSSHGLSVCTLCGYGSSVELFFFIYQSSLCTCWLFFYCNVCPIDGFFVRIILILIFFLLYINLLSFVNFVSCYFAAPELSMKLL